MTVEKLIKELQKLDPELVVRTLAMDQYGYAYDTGKIEITCDACSKIFGGNNQTKIVAILGILAND